MFFNGETLDKAVFGIFKKNSISFKLSPARVGLTRRLYGDFTDLGCTTVDLTLDKIELSKTKKLDVFRKFLDLSWPKI